MIQGLFEAPRLPFTVSLLVMGCIAALELLTMIWGAAASHLLDSAIAHADADAGGDVADDAALGDHGDSPFASLLDVLGVGKVPLLVLIVLYTCSFGVLGLALQAIVTHVRGAPLDARLAAPVTLVVMVPVVRLLASGLSRVFPKEQTAAVPRSSFVGKLATITLGTAARGAPAQAKLRDQHGQAHYVLVEPASEQEQFVAGTTVVLVEQSGVLFRAVREPLLDSAPEH